jgi:transcriptional regulator with XRE-family HTH domain
MNTPAASLSGPDDPGQGVAAARKARGLTQGELARQAAVSLSLLRKIEQGTRSLTPGVRTALQAVLAPVPAADDSATAPGRIAAALPQLREVMDTYDIPPDLPYVVQPLTELRRRTNSATAWRLSCEYTKLAGLVPGLITDLTVVAFNSAGHAQEQAFAQLALAYRAADAIADKHGQHDMSGRATELIRWSAARSADPQLEMMSAYVRAELFFSGQHARYGLRMIDSATPPAPRAGDVPLLAMRGALTMRAAVLAARAGMPGEAADRIAEAQAAAQHVPEGIYHGTAFGPGSVRVHELALAVETGDVARAIKLADRWQPSPALPAERRSHFHIDTARAYCWAGNQEQAVTALWQARRAAPQHTRCNPSVIKTIHVLLRSSRKPPAPLLQLANWAAVTAAGTRWL